MGTSMFADVYSFESAPHLVYKASLSKKQAIEKFRSKVIGRKTLDDAFQKKFLERCIDKNVHLKYYPIVEISAKLQEVVWLYRQTQEDDVKYYRDSSSCIRLEKEPNGTGFVKIYRDEISGNIDKEGLTVKKVFESEKLDGHSEIEEQYLLKSMLVEFSDKDLDILTEQCKLEIDESLKKHAQKIIHSVKPDSNIVSIESYDAEYTSPKILFYPVYIFEIDNIKLEIDAITGKIKVPNMPHNKIYHDKVKEYEKRDIIMTIYHFSVLAILLGFMIYVLYRTIPNAFAQIESYAGSETYMADKVLMIIINIIACIIWLAGIIFIGFLSFHSEYKEAYIKAEKDNNASPKVVNSGMLMNELIFIGVILFGVALVIAYICLHTLVFPGGIKEAFEVVFHF